MNEEITPLLSTGIGERTKYLKKQSTTVYVPSSASGLPQPLSCKRVCPPPRTKGCGTHSPAAKGMREFQFRQLEKMLRTLPTLCVSVSAKPYEI